jgi:threonine/homoserine/homoserine lactone efflux protein
MALLLFLLEAMFISLSGVMAPGPMTAVTVGKGNQSPHAGAWIAVGHGVVEFPLMVAVFFGVGYLLELAYVKAAIALVGGAFLLFMGIGMFRSSVPGDGAIERLDGGGDIERWDGALTDTRSPVIAGIVLSVGNPYFLIWWATVGAALVLRAVRFGLVGFVTFAVLHWSCDFVWSYLLSALSFKGGRVFGPRFQRAVFVGCGVALVFFSSKLMIDGVRTLFA